MDALELTLETLELVLTASWVANKIDHTDFDRKIKMIKLKETNLIFWYNFMGNFILLFIFNDFTSIAVYKV